jgi:plasmid maintenance system antidote protein VapI
MYNNVWSKYEALARILGISKKELASLCGSSDKITLTLSEAQISQRAIRAFDKIMAQFDTDTQEKIFKLRDALMTTNYKSITAKKRFTSLGNLIIALGFTQTELAEMLKVPQGMISKIVNNTQDKNDALDEKITNWLNARYSVLSNNDREKVDLLKTALDIVGCVKTNPYRKQLIEIGALNALPKPVESTKEVKELKEYIKLLEEENETLRDRVEELKDRVESLETIKANNEKTMDSMNEENETLRKKNIESEAMVTKLFKENEAMDQEIMDLNRELEVRNTSNAGLQDGVTDLNQKIDELEAKIFRLEEEKEALINMNENLGNGVSPFKFENCIVNIYTKEDI